MPELIAWHLEENLMMGFVSLASATLAISGFGSMAPVQFEGAVKTPGPVAIQSTTSLKSIVTLAGGFSKEADLRNVQVRSTDGKTRTWNLYEIGMVPTVQPGDVVVAPKLDATKVVFVDGAVRNLAPIDFKPGLTLAQVLSVAKPVNGKQLDRVVVTRVGEDKPTVIRADKTDWTANTFALMPGDRIHAPHARVAQTSDRQLLTILIVVLALIVIAD